MGRPLRFVPARSLVEVTTRTVHGRLLLRPSAEVNELIRGIVGRAQELFPVQIHALVVLSNHWHALLSVEHTAQLAGFMAFVNGNIAREVGRLHNWPQRFWSGRYRAIVVADEDAAIQRLRYILSNGCKEGLVDSPADWPGVSCVLALLEGRPLQGTWYDRTAEYRACRGGHSIARETFAKRYEITLAKLPAWAHLSDAEYQGACADLVKGIETDTRAERHHSGRPAVGVARVLAQAPHDLPVDSARSPAPLVHASCPQVRMAFRRAYDAFVDAFRSATTSLRSGSKAIFPSCSFPPGAPFILPLPAAA